jgi:glycosyltransferase involved in cell wall biosynthesis
MRKPDGSRGAQIIAAVALPPPLHGQSLVNAHVVKKLQESDSRTEVLDISPGAASRGAAYHARRLLRVLKAASMIIYHRRRRQRTLYAVLEAGQGIYYNFMLVSLARFFNYKIFLHHHSAQHTLQGCGQFETLLSLAGPMTHIVLSEGMAGDLRSRFPRAREVVVCHNAGVVKNEDEIERKPDLNRSIKVGHLSNLSSEKGLDVVIETVTMGRKRGLPLELVIAGPATGAAEQTIKNAQQSLGGALDFRGPVTGPAKDLFFRDIDVFFFPTRYAYEAQPLVILEAMSAGVPVIATDRGYIREMLGDTGYILPINSDICLLTLDIMKEFVLAPTIFATQSAATRQRFETLKSRSTIEIAHVVKMISVDI